MPSLRRNLGGGVCVSVFHPTELFLMVYLIPLIIINGLTSLNDMHIPFLSDLQPVHLKTSIESVRQGNILSHVEMLAS